MKTTLLSLMMLISLSAFAQVGIGTTDPKAILDIKSTNQTSPLPTDGMLVPKIDTFPATNPGVDQQGMLVYLTTIVGTNQPGFYYWDNSTTAWVPIGNNSNSDWSLNGNSGTDDTVNFVGTTDNHDLVFKRNNLESGRLGETNTSFGMNSMIFITTGNRNSAFGVNALMNNGDGFENSAFGIDALLNNSFGSYNTAIGKEAMMNNLGGHENVAVGDDALRSNRGGRNNTAVGTNSLNTSNNSNFSSSFGFAARTISDLNNATAIGARAMVGADNSLVLGSINGVNGATADVNVGIGTTTPQDKLHVVGNIRMIDGNEATGRLMVSDANGTASWTNTAAISSGTLDQAYDFGGAGNGRTITADTGAVLINGTDGFVSTGTAGSGAIAPSGSGIRMVWNPRKGAFRAGMSGTNHWDDINIGGASVAFGSSTIASADYSAAFGRFNIASGEHSVVFGSSNNASGLSSAAFGDRTNATGVVTTAFGGSTTASGHTSTSFGNSTIASGDHSTVFGRNNESRSFAETVIGIGATTYTESVDGATRFRTANATDRLFVIGNAIDANNNGLLDASERRDAMVVLKNGNTGIGSSTPQDRLHIVGNIRMVDGNQALGRVLTSNANGTATWQNASANAWGLIGNTLTDDTVNFMGTTDNEDVVFKRNNVQAGKISASNTSFGASSLLSTTTGTSNTGFGAFALTDNTTGSFNSAFGRLALRDNVNGANNSAFGYQSQANTTLGQSNSSFGQSSLLNNTSGGFNTAIGRQSLTTNTTGGANTALGALSDVAGVNLTNATAIGANAEVGASNSLVLGSINGVNGGSADVNVGIGTTSPSRKLTVVANGGSAGAAYNADAMLVVDRTGDDAYIGIYSDDNQSSALLFGNSINSSHGGVYYNTANTFDMRFRTGGNNTRMTITGAGDVGIGTLAPIGQFQLSLNEAFKPGSAFWVVVSDERLKTINGAYTKGLNEILQLNPIRYNYKNVGDLKFEQEILDTEFPGFSAQQVQTIFPDAVKTRSNDYLSLDLQPILIASINAIKELNSKIEQKNKALETQIQDQNSVIQNLLERIERLERK